MTYIVERNTRFYVVAFDGLDPLTGRERRRWVPIGHDRAEAESVAARLDSERIIGPAPRRGTITVGEFLTRTWMPHKRRHVRATTAYRYAWFINRYINPAIGDIPLRRLRADHLDDLYERLATTGGRQGAGLAPKTIAEVHMIACGPHSMMPLLASSSAATSPATSAAGGGQLPKPPRDRGPLRNCTSS